MAKRRRPDDKAESNSINEDCKSEFEQRLQNAKATPSARYTKGLQHDPNTGQVDESQFEYFIDQLLALNANPGTGAKAGWKLRDSTPENIRHFVNPQAGWALDTQMTGPCCYTIPAPPGINTVEEAAEVCELYWMAVLRDLPFQEWDDSALIAEAAAELSTLPLFVNHISPNSDPSTAPYEAIALNSKSLFRGGELARFRNPNIGVSENVGPYISQFLLHDIGYGTLTIPQRNIHAAPEINYMTDWTEWIKVQNGERRNAKLNLLGVSDPSQRRYISSMRDLATYVHFDQLYEAYLNAALILLAND